MQEMKTSNDFETLVGAALGMYTPAPTWHQRFKPRWHFADCCPFLLWTSANLGWPQSTFRTVSPVAQRAIKAHVVQYPTGVWMQSAPSLQPLAVSVFA